MEGTENSRFNQTANAAVTVAVMAVNTVQVAEVLSSCSKVAKEERSGLGEPGSAEGKYNSIGRLGEPENAIHQLLVPAGFKLEMKRDAGQ